jgi:hypothetical protein
MVRSQTQWLIPLITLPPVCPAIVLRVQQQALDIRSRERTTTNNGWSNTGKIDAHQMIRYRIQGAWRIHRPGNCGGDYRLEFLASNSSPYFPITGTNAFFGMVRSQTQWLVPLITLPPVCPAFVLRLQQQALDILGTVGT